MLYKKKSYIFSNILEPTISWRTSSKDYSPDSWCQKMVKNKSGFDCSTMKYQKDNSFIELKNRNQFQMAMNSFAFQCFQLYLFGENYSYQFSMTWQTKLHQSLMGIFETSQHQNCPIYRLLLRLVLLSCPHALPCVHSLRRLKTSSALLVSLC